MWNFQIVFWILLSVPISLPQHIQDIYNLSENKSYKGIWTLEDKNHKLDAHQVEGIIKFSHNSISYKGFGNKDQQDEQFFGDISLNANFFSIALRGIGNTHIKADNSFIQCENEFSVVIQVDNTKTMDDRQLIVIFDSSNHELPQCNQLLKFTTQTSNEENQLQISITEWFSFIFFAFQLALPWMFRMFVLNKKMNLSELSMIAIYFKFGELDFIYLFILSNFELYFNKYMYLIIKVMYFLYYLVWGLLLAYFLDEKTKNYPIFQEKFWKKVLIHTGILFGVIVFNKMMYILSFHYLFVQLCYAFVLYPQIIHNIQWNSTENFNLFYLLACLSSGLIFSTYLPFYQGNINYLFISLFYSIYFISLLILYLQHKYGSMCIIPEWALNKYFKVCSICLESITTADQENQLLFRPVIQTSCNHKFHEDCLKQWFVKSKDCPLCREMLDQNL